MNICHKYGIKWRYEFNHTKSRVVTFGETKPLCSKSMKEREWMLGDAIVNELYEYNNLGVLKNYVNSFASNVEDNIEKARKKPLIYIKCLCLLLKVQSGIISRAKENKF